MRKVRKKKRVRKKREKKKETKVSFQYSKVCPIELSGLNTCRFGGCLFV